MNEFLTVLALAAMPALGNFVGGLLSEVFPVSERVLSWALHLAAGIILAVIGIELMPEVLSANLPWLVIFMFVAGGGFSIVLDRSVDLIRNRLGNTREDTDPWMIYVGTAIDLFSDGIIIGTGSTINPALGLLLALGQVPADVPEGFATIASFRQKGVARLQRILLSLSFAVPIFIGATVGYWAVRDQPAIVKLSLLAFTAGLLLVIAVEEMVTQAHDNRQPGEETDPWEVIALVVGFALFALISVYVGQ
ncbi:MAG: hypothetical protein OHK0046_38450 [Anaerolineae bacterium]|jgi:ZIP family zinc transporter